MKTQDFQLGHRFYDSRRTDPTAIWFGRQLRLDSLFLMSAATSRSIGSIKVSKTISNISYSKNKRYTRIICISSYDSADILP